MAILYIITREFHPLFTDQKVRDSIPFGRTSYFKDWSKPHRMCQIVSAVS